MENIKTITYNDFHRMEMAAKQSVEYIPAVIAGLKKKLIIESLLVCARTQKHALTEKLST